MSEQAAERIWSGIDIGKTLAGALAAVCAAVIGSFLGVAGTLIGAALASIIGTVGTEIYHRSIKRGAAKLHTLAPTFVTAPAAVGTPEVAAATDEDKPSETVPEAERSPGRKIRWKRVALIAAGVFVLAMGSLTLVELFAGKSVASMVGNTSSGSTTFGSVTGGGNDQPQDRAPVQQPSTGPSTGATEPTDGGSAPAGTPTTEPTGTPATGGTTTEPTGTPTTGAPADPGTPDSGTGDGTGDGTGEGGGQPENDQPKSGTQPDNSEN